MCAHLTFPNPCLSLPTLIHQCLGLSQLSLYFPHRAACLPLSLFHIFHFPVCTPHPFPPPSMCVFLRCWKFRPSSCALNRVVWTGLSVNLALLTSDIVISGIFLFCFSPRPTQQTRYWQIKMQCSPLLVVDRNLWHNSDTLVWQKVKWSTVLYYNTVLFDCSLLPLWVSQISTRLEIFTE